MLVNLKKNCFDSSSAFYKLNCSTTTKGSFAAFAEKEKGKLGKFLNSNAAGRQGKHLDINAIGGWLGKIITNVANNQNKPSDNKPSNNDLTNGRQVGFV